MEHEIQNFLSPTAYSGGQKLWGKETLKEKIRKLNEKGER